MTDEVVQAADVVVTMAAVMPARFCRLRSALTTTDGTPTLAETEITCPVVSENSSRAQAQAARW